MFQILHSKPDFQNPRCLFPNLGLRFRIICSAFLISASQSCPHCGATKNINNISFWSLYWIYQIRRCFARRSSTKTLSLLRLPPRTQPRSQPSGAHRRRSFATRFGVLNLGRERQSRNGAIVGGFVQCAPAMRKNSQEDFGSAAATGRPAAAHACGSSARKIFVSESVSEGDE